MCTHTHTHIYSDLSQQKEQSKTRSQKHVSLDDTGLGYSFSAVTQVLNNPLLGNLDCNKMLYDLNYALWDCAFKGSPEFLSNCSAFMHSAIQQFLPTSNRW